MKSNSLITILLFIFLAGCLDRGDPDTVKSDHKIHDELGPLPKIMSMPATPLKVKWQLSGDINLCALLTYSPEDYQFVVENSTPFEIINNVKIDASFYREWLENEIKLDVIYHGDYDRYEIIRAQAVQANLFTKAQYSPFVNGSVTLLGHGKVLVSLDAM